MKRKAMLVLVATAVLAWSAAAAHAAEASQEGVSENVLVTVRMGTLDDGKRETLKTYTLIVATGTVGSKLLAGERVPFPSARPDAGEGAAGIVYQNIGFVTEIRAWPVDKKTIRVAADIEDSRVQRVEGQPPTVETRQLAVNAVLTDGVPLELTRVDGVTDREGFVEIEAKFLR